MGKNKMKNYKCPRCGSISFRFAEVFYGNMKRYAEIYDGEIMDINDEEFFPDMEIGETYLECAQCRVRVDKKGCKKLLRNMDKDKLKFDYGFNIEEQ